MKKSRNKNEASRPSQRNTSSRRDPVRKDPRPRREYEDPYDRRSASSSGNQYRDSYNERYNDRYSDRYDARTPDRRREPSDRRPSGSAGDRPRTRKPAPKRRSFPISTVILLLVVLVLLVFLMRSCISESLGRSDYELVIESQTLTVGATTKAEVKGLLEGDTVTFSSSDQNVVTVDSSSGLIEGRRQGTATIAATVNGKTLNKTISVADADAEATSVTISSKTLNLEKGDSFTLLAEVTGGNSEGPVLINWSSSDTAVARVSQEGRVTATGVGKAIITAKVGNQSDACEVTVGEIPADDPPTTPVVPPSDEPGADDGQTGDTPTDPGGDTSGVTPTSISLNASVATLIVGSNRTLELTVTPQEAAALPVTWASSDPAVATVTEDGQVTGVATGTAQISATVGGFEAICTIIVQ